MKFVLSIALVLLIVSVSQAQPPVVYEAGGKMVNGEWTFATFIGLESRYLGLDWRGGYYYSPNLSDISPDAGDDFQGASGFLGRKVLNPLGGGFEWYIYPAIGGRVEIANEGDAGSGLLKLEGGFKILGLLGLGIGADWKVNDDDIFVYGQVDLTESLLGK